MSEHSYHRATSRYYFLIFNYFFKHIFYCVSRPNDHYYFKQNTPWANALTTELHLAPIFHYLLFFNFLKIFFILYHVRMTITTLINNTHHERTLLPQSYISLLFKKKKKNYIFFF